MRRDGPGNRSAERSQRYRVRVDLPAHEWLRFYSGEARQVIAEDESGRRIAFPAVALRPYTRRDGVHGWFWIETGPDGRLAAVRPAPSPP